MSQRKAKRVSGRGEVVRQWDARAALLNSKPSPGSLLVTLLAPESVLIGKLVIFNFI